MTNFKPSVTPEELEEVKDQARQFLARAFEPFAAPEVRQGAARALARIVALWTMAGPDPDILTVPAMNSYVYALMHGPTPEGGPGTIYHCGTCALVVAALSRAGCDFHSFMRRVTPYSHALMVGRVRTGAEADAWVSGVLDARDARVAHRVFQARGCRHEFDAPDGLQKCRKCGLEMVPF